MANIVNYFAVLSTAFWIRNRRAPVAFLYTKICSTCSSTAQMEHFELHVLVRKILKFKTVDMYSGF